MELFFVADESNWRNDYPDEDEGLSDSSQERRFYADYGFDSGKSSKTQSFSKLIIIIVITFIIFIIIIINFNSLRFSSSHLGCKVNLFKDSKRA